MGGFDQAQKRPAQGSLSAARFTDQPQGISSPDGKAHLIHRMDLPNGVAQQTVFDGKVLRQGTNVQQNFFFGVHAFYGLGATCTYSG